MNFLSARQPRGATVVFGVVGGVGSGKSFTTAEFVAQGAARFDADEQARALYDDPDVLALLKKRWPDAVDSQNGVDRVAVAQIVFAPTERGRRELAFLNGVFHPRILQKYRVWLENERANRREFVVLDAPLLIEVGWDRYVDYLVFVDASEQTRRRRTQARGWSGLEFKRREARQTPIEVKRARADFIVNADQDDSQMARQVAQILDAVRSSRGE
ncbi:MAG: dephospho-CoA kinase [Thermoguttaceae bacterium]|nr:dephospho-CoA kinase [Thermoguttaceae bacterium]MBQ1864181.1 dephospho-CoA kinase [Thermoguttaceae bacterium]MBQ2039571.1 dephospho-CoA kinase [Thermoguttaceae bacterium]MBQ3823108.1 dephospho-CoA kinase [Thermoguttaceae bacterium]MBQ4080166.1 dephospho-CoA kinase [Thermoguttaceae bacterium]